MARSIKQCEYCNGTGVITILLNTGCVYDGWEEPIYDDIPCEECGCTGLNMEEQAELNFNSVLEDNKKLRARLAEVEAQRKLLTNLVDAAVLAIGEHNAPSDCYTPTASTENTVVCPACRFISMLEALAKPEDNK